jgi:hypothetical protein
MALMAKAEEMSISENGGEESGSEESNQSKKLKISAINGVMKA